MKLGVFDSGLGGLIISKAIHDAMPDISQVYFGDTLHLPYGNRSQELIYQYTRSAMEFLFGEHDCAVIIVACNTASAAALRRLQQEWLPEHYPERRILGVVVPTLEEAISHGAKKIGLIGTNYIVSSDVYAEELKKLDPDIEIYTQAAPLLVPLIENNGEKWLDDVLDDYLAPLHDAGIESLILGCTHYAGLKDKVRAKSDVRVISQDEIIPLKLADYLCRHPEFDEKLDRGGVHSFYVSDLTQSYLDSARKIYGAEIDPQEVMIGDA